MDVLILIIAVSGLCLFARRDIYIFKLSFKASLKGIEFDISTKEKNGSPSQSNRSNRNN